MKKIISILAITLFASSISFGQVDEEYEKTLWEMFKVSGTDASYKMVIDQVFTIYKGEYTDVDDETWKALKKEFNESAIKDLVSLLTPVYHKHLTQADLEEIIKFYETSIGKKYANSMPLIGKEAMQIGAEWGMKMHQKFKDKMKENRH
ncbi:MAG: DUF2059 domain-containing protein [Bacteroidales bacterium]|nr:DUF2059 domain-containing protein [Bacteroidales bacterium]